MKKEDKNTRYYIDLNMETRKIIGWDFDQREKLILEKQAEPVVRIFITKGQYKKIK